MLNLSAATPYLFGLVALGVLFSTEELSGSLMFQSGRSDKTPLDQDRVDLLIRAINKKFGSSGWNLKILKSKINKKCRNTKV